MFPRAIKNNYLNLLLREKRRHGKNTSDEVLSEIADNFNTEDSIIKLIESSNLHKAFKNLSKNDIELICELYFRGATIKEVAESLNVSYTAIYRRKIKALNILMNSLKSEMQDKIKKENSSAQLSSKINGNFIIYIILHL